MSYTSDQTLDFGVAQQLPDVTFEQPLDFAVIKGATLLVNVAGVQSERRVFLKRGGVFVDADA